VEPAGAGDPFAVTHPKGIFIFSRLDKRFLGEVGAEYRMTTGAIK
jgi:hypothetical protein